MWVRTASADKWINLDYASEATVQYLGAPGYGVIASSETVDTFALQADAKTRLADLIQHLSHWVLAANGTTAVNLKKVVKIEVNGTSVQTINDLGNTATISSYATFADAQAAADDLVGKRELL